MPATAILFDEVFGRHETLDNHPECPERLLSVARAIEAVRDSGTIIPLKSRPATLDQIALCHDPDYVEGVLTEIRTGRRELAGGDVSVSLESGAVALRAVGGVLKAVDAVLTGEAGNAFCAVRPPGHHARPAAAMGFCLFNNIAIAARHAQKTHGLERVAIVDWDVHHGNGTQEIFYSDGSVLFFSTHQSPWYPGTGKADERGDGKGDGKIINRPFGAGSGHDEILGAFKDSLLPALREFRPEMILISAGFDSRRGDPLGSFRLSDADFSEMTRMLLDVAAQHCDARLVSVLEGGYDLQGLEMAAQAHLTELLRA